MEQPVPANPSMLGKSPPSPGGAPPELIDAKKVGNRRRTTSTTRHRYTQSTNSEMHLMLQEYNLQC